MKELKIVFAAIGGAFLVWALGIGISQYLADEPARKLKAKAHTHNDAQIDSASTGTKRGSLGTDSAQTISELEKSHFEKPEDEERLIRFANALFEKGIGEGDAESLKKAVGLYHEVLDKLPDQPDALLGLGTLSLHVGVSDRAIEYYEKYLSKNPDDISVKANLALAIGRGGDKEKSLKILDDLLNKDPEFVIGLVTKGLLLAESGEKSLAVTLWKKAREIEKNPSLKERIDGLIFTAGNSEQNFALNNRPEGEEHSHTLDYFKTNEITKPKFAGAELMPNGSLKIALRNFPADSMPPFAREKFESNTRTNMEKDNISKVIIIDSESKSTLLSISR
ncbi:MAG TPA: tetratricopeptide repeat protein [Oligoflexia bacterium]|nr:tetratricopeptide repeat protein [Oligoflexia bacterium]HMP48393.1 tetratricopeptide repeat protein [Oligoflexia bacterium]